MAAGYCYSLGIKSNNFFLKDNKKAFILWLNAPKVTAYKHVKIGGGTRISDSNHHSLDYKIRRTSRDCKLAKSAPVIIGDDVFIGANCYIGKGVTIGDRSIVAAGSVVVKSIPADEIWGGNPAIFIKKITN